jgi:TRAP-type transport system small permease protein
MQLGWLNTVDRIMAGTMRWVGALCLVALLLLVGAGVFVRFVPVSSMGWADEIVEFGFAWLVFFGAALLWRNRTHFRVDFLEQLASGSRFARPLALVVEAIGLLFLAVLAIQGWELTLAAVDTSPILELPKSLWYAVIPISAVIMIGYSVRDVLRLVLHGSMNASGASADEAACKPGTEY